MRCGCVATGARIVFVAMPMAMEAVTSMSDAYTDPKRVWFRPPFLPTTGIQNSTNPIATVVTCTNRNH